MAQGHGGRGVRRAARFAAGLLTRSIGKFLADRCPSLATALAYATLLALVPITVLSFSIFSAFSSSAAMEEKVRSLLFSHFLPTSGDLIYGYIRAFAKHAGTLSFLGLVVLILTAFSLVTMLEKAFLQIWRIPKSRSIFERFLAFWAAITLVPILIGLSLYLSTTLGPLPYLAWVYRVGALLIPLFTTWAAFFLLYRFLPRAGVPWGSALAGALVAGTLWEGAKLGFDGYVKHFSTLTEIYGSLGIIPLFLFWLYLTWILVLYGAEVTYLVQVPQPLPWTSGGFSGHRAFYGLLALLAISQAFRRGERPLTSRGLALKVAVDGSLLASVLARFEAAGILITTGSGERSYVLARTPESIPFWDALEAVRGEEGLASPGARDPLGRYLQDLLARVSERERTAWGPLTLQEVSREAEEFMLSEVLGGPGSPYESSAFPR